MQSILDKINIFIALTLLFGFMQNALACLGGAVQLAASATSIPVSFTSPTEIVDTVQSSAVGAVNLYMSGLEAPSVATFNLGIANGIMDVVDLFNSLKSAYDSCAP